LEVRNLLFIKKFFFMITFIIAFLVLAIALVYVYNSRNTNYMKINIGFHYFESAQSLDPAQIDTIYQSNLIENIFSRLLEYDNNGQLICTLCEKFWIEDKTIFFELKKNLKTVDGNPITAKNVENSLKRLVKLNTNTHGNLRHFIDIDSNGFSESILANDNILKIETRQSHFPQFVLPLLASMDFSVIPSSSIKLKDGKEVIDFRNTSGPYFIKKDDKNGNIQLEANPYHPHYSEDMPININIVPLEYEKGVEAFLSGKVDILDTTYYSYDSEFEKLFLQKEKQFNASQTIPLGIAMVVFSKEAIKKFSSAERFHFGRLIGDAFVKLRRYQWGMKPAYEFFQSNGAGHLTEVELKEIELLRSSPLSEKPKKIQFGVWHKAFESYKEALKNHPEIAVQSFDKNPSFLEPKDRPEAYIFLTDSSFNEDVSLLSYSFSTERFANNKAEAFRWLEEYLSIEEKDLRVEKLRKLQLDLLKSPAIYPIGATPYFAISNKDLELNFPKLFAGSPWWQIRKK